MNSTERATMRGIPGDAARKRGLKRILLPMVAFALLMGLGLGLTLGALMPWSLGLGILILAATGLNFLIYVRRQPAMVYGFFKGARGEEMTASELARLPAAWTVFHGIVLPNGHDIDHIAIGPQGVFVIETKYWSGVISVEQGQVLANGRVVNKSPVVQVRTSVNALSATTGLPPEQFRGVLCFAGSHLPLGGVAADEIMVCSHLDLIDLLCRGERTLSDVDLARVVTRLNELTITKGL